MPLPRPSLRCSRLYSSQHAPTKEDLLSLLKPKAARPRLRDPQSMETAAAAPRTSSFIMDDKYAPLRLKPSKAPAPHHRSLSPAQCALRSNPYAQILASPVRQCNLTRIRVPQALLIPLIAIAHPGTEVIAELNTKNEEEIGTGTASGLETGAGAVAGAEGSADKDAVPGARGQTSPDANFNANSARASSSRPSPRSRSNEQWIVSDYSRTARPHQGGRVYVLNSRRVLEHLGNGAYRKLNFKLEEQHEQRPRASGYTDTAHGYDARGPRTTKGTGLDSGTEVRAEPRNGNRGSVVYGSRTETEERRAVATPLKIEAPKRLVWRDDMVQFVVRDMERYAKGITLGE